MELQDIFISAAQVWLCVYLSYRLICWLLTSCTVRDWDKKYVLITGCDSGFGRELALRLDDKGFKVIACCLFEQSCEELRGSGSGKITALQLDVTDPASVERVRTALVTILPEKTGLWGLVNNAGIVGSPSTFLLLNTPEDIEHCLNINMLGQLRLAQACFPMLREAGGRVVNMSSMNGIYPMMFLPYSLSKYGVEIMSDLMRREFRQFGISVSIVEPGANPATGIQLDTKAFNRSFEAAPQYIKDVFGEGYDVKTIDAMVGSKKRHVGNKTDKEAKVNHHSVTDAYIQALTSRFPYARYLVGIDNRIVAFLHWILPVFVFDVLVGQLVKHGLKVIKPASLVRDC